MYTTVEKVIFLQKVDVFEHVPTDQLALLAAITKEETAQKKDEIYRENDASDSLYIVIKGKVELKKGEETISHAKPGEAFGTWALFDEAPRMAGAVAAEDSTLLKLDREDFYDIMADNSEITKSILKALSGRLRGILERLQTKSSNDTENSKAR